MSTLSCDLLAEEISAAYAKRELMAAPSSRDPSFDLTDAYAVEAELTRLRRADGWSTVGRKVGYANKALWRALKLDTLVWASMYDRTVKYSVDGHATLDVQAMISPRIEPEIVVRLKKPVESAEPAAVLDAVDWLAIGFEIIDCIFPGWKFQPADFVSAYGLHAALIVGQPRTVGPGMVEQLVEQLPLVKVRLMKGHELVDEGSGKNALRSPLLCVGELASAMSRRQGADALAAGELISTGTLTASHPVASGEQWKVEVEGLDLPNLDVHIV